MSDFIRKVIPGLAMLIIGALLGALGTYWQNQQASRIRYLEFVTNAYRLLSPLSIPEQKLEVLLNKKPIENLSQISVDIYNTTDQDYDQVGIFIDLLPEEGDSLRLVREEFAGVVPQTVTKNDSIHQPNERGAIRLGYKVDNATRWGSKPIFSAKFLVEGKPSQTADVNISKKGVRARQIPYPPYETNWWESEIFLISLVVTVYLLMNFYLPRIMSRLLKKKTEERKNKLKSYLTEKISERLKEPAAKLEAEVIVTTVLTFQEAYKWETTPKWLRVLSGEKPPNV